MHNEHVEAVIEAAARDEATRSAYTLFPEDELGWVLEDPTGSPHTDSDPTPPNREAVARRDEWLRARVDAVVKAGPQFKEGALAVENVFCKTGQGGGIDPTCGGGGGKAGSGAVEGAKFPAVGSTVTIDGTRYVVEPLDGDDSFPPAVASYEIKQGYLMYTGRNGGEGVVSGSKKDVEKWMDQVRKEVQSRPTAETTPRPWTPADGGAQHVETAKSMVSKTAEVFGIPAPRTEISVVGRALESGSHSPDRVSLNNPHQSTPNTSLNFKSAVSYEVHIAAHETAHAAFSAKPDVAQKYMKKLAESGEKVSAYHALGGNFEGLMDLGAAYVHSPKELKQYNPKLYGIAEGWAKESRGAAG